ncbi:hypothetical protein LTR84_012022 [Exophiala bonariae]|uniref:REJ domain-containing protein n=1 Tax=Exophiala bonariae TaxID=1690606 RepID=A0AAV9MRX7_9EURO|nr:hypothetical protein LTR84_012022 [Exophiala bonariae]
MGHEPDLDIHIGGNSTFLTINVTLSDDGEMGNVSLGGLPFMSALLPTEASRRSTTFGPMRTSRLTTSTSSAKSSLLMASTTTRSVATSTIAPLGFTTQPSSTPSLPPITMTNPTIGGIGDAFPFTNTSSASSASLIIVILRTLFG